LKLRELREAKQLAMNESTKLTKNRKRGKNNTEYFTSDSTNKASPSRNASEMEETAKLEQLAAITSSMVVDSLKVSNQAIQLQCKSLGLL